MTNRELREGATALSFFCAAYAALVVLTGCNPAGYADAFAPNDPVIHCSGETTTWMRNYLEPGYAVGEEDLALRTEFLIVRGRRDSTTGDTIFDQTGCMHLATIQRDGSIVLEQGNFIAEGAQAGTWEIPRVYSFVHQPQLSILQRTGAQSMENAPPTERTVAFSASGANLTLTIEGEDHHFVDMLSLLGQVDRTTPDGAVLMGQLLNVGLLVSQARIRGFGGAGMTDYISSAKSFEGLLFGAMTVSASVGLGTVHVVIDYGTGMDDPFVDFTGMTMWGPQNVDVSWAGNGSLAGRTDFVIAFDPNDPSQDLVGYFDYQGVTVQDGFGSGGTGTLNLDGTSFSVATDTVLITDFQSILPLD